MPYKDKQKEIEHRKKYYKENKHRWKNSNGTWKTTQHKERRKASARKWWIKKKGLPIPSIDEIINNMVGVCPICHKEKKLVYDHNHATLIHRGWICNECNLVLGFAEDNPGILMRAIIYLKVGDV